MFILSFCVINALRMYDKRIKIVNPLPRWFRGYLESLYFNYPYKLLVLMDKQ